SLQLTQFGCHWNRANHASQRRAAECSSLRSAQYLNPLDIDELDVNCRAARETGRTGGRRFSKVSCNRSPREGSVSGGRGLESADHDGLTQKVGRLADTGHASEIVLAVDQRASVDIVHGEHANAHCHVLNALASLCGGNGHLLNGSGILLVPTSTYIR